MADEQRYGMESVVISGLLRESSCLASLCALAWVPFRFHQADQAAHGARDASEEAKEVGRCQEGSCRR